MRTVLRGVSEFFDSRSRGVCVWLGFAFLFGLTTFPPWIEYQLYATQPQAILTRLWHARVDREPMDNLDDGAFVDVDYRRMVTEIVTAESFVLALYLTWGRTRGRGDV